MYRSRPSASDRLGAWSRLEHQLRPAVTVEVVDEELGVVRARPDVDAEADAVEQGAVETVGVEVHRPGVADLGDVLGVARVPLHHVLVLAVAVHVTDAHVVGAVGVALTRRRHAVRRLAQRQVVEGRRPRGHRFRPLDGHAPHERRDLVARTGFRGGVEVGRARGDGGDPPAIAVHGELRPRHAGGVAPVTSLPRSRQLRCTPRSVVAATSPRSRRSSRVPRESGSMPAAAGDGSTSAIAITAAGRALRREPTLVPPRSGTVVAVRMNRFNCRRKRQLP